MVEDREFVLRQLKLLDKDREMEASYHVSRVMEDKGFIKALYIKPDGKGRSIKKYIPFGRGKLMLNAAKRRDERARAERAEKRRNASKGVDAKFSNNQNAD
jgi:hypothetical protein